MPFGPYKDFADCVKKNKGKKNPEAYCASIEKKIKGKMKNKKLSLKILGSGSDLMARNKGRGYSSLAIKHNNKTILIDCGDFPRTRKEIDNIDYLLLTQPKWDKTIGFYEFLNYDKDNKFKNNIEIVCNSSTYNKLRNNFKQHTDVYKFKTFGDKAIKTFSDNDLKVTAFPVTFTESYPTHGYKITDGKKIIVYTPSFKTLSPVALKNADIWIADGEGCRKKSYLHADFNTIKRYAETAKVKKVVLTNLVCCEEELKEKLDKVKKNFELELSKDGQTIELYNKGPTFELSKEELNALTEKDKIEKNAIVLSKYHIYDIFKEEAKGIVRTEEHKELYRKEVFLVDGNFAYGTITLGECKKITAKEFKELANKHNMGQYAKKKQFGKKTKLFYYNINVKEIFNTPIPINPIEGEHEFLTDFKFQIENIDEKSETCELSKVKTDPKIDHRDKLIKAAKDHLPKIQDKRKELFNELVNDPTENTLNRLYYNEDFYVESEQLDDFVVRSYLNERGRRIINEKDKTNLIAFGFVVTGALLSTKWDEMSALRTAITQRKTSPEELAEIYNKFSNNFERVMRTESKRLAEEGRLTEYENRGISEVIYRAQPTACPICQDYDGKKFSLGEEPNIPGDTHPNCECHFETVKSEKLSKETIERLSFNVPGENYNRLASIKNLKSGANRDRVIRVVALASGVWNGLTYDYEKSEFEKHMQGLVGLPVKINHEPAFTFGRVIRVGGDKKNKWIWADIYIEDKHLYEQAKDKKIGVSVGVKAFHQSTSYGALAKIRGWDEISFTSEPACYKCVAV